MLIILHSVAMLVGAYSCCFLLLSSQTLTFTKNIRSYMKKIGLVSDTHGFWDDKLTAFFSEVDEIWHAGDIGSIELYDKLNAGKKLRAVYGNIDGGATRLAAKPFLFFEIEGFRVLMAHIGGYPNKYDREFLQKIVELNPSLAIAGHSHILKVMFDKKHDLMFLNPGAAGVSGFHAVRTALRFTLDNGAIKDLEVAEWERKA